MKKRCGNCEYWQSHHFLGEKEIGFIGFGDCEGALLKNDFNNSMKHYNKKGCQFWKSNKKE